MPRSGQQPSIVDSLEAIVTHLKRRRRPAARLLQPGLTPEQIAKLEICLPHSRGAVDILINAAFAYLELGDVERVFDCFRKAKKRGVRLKRYLSDPALEALASDRRLIALKRTR